MIIRTVFGCHFIKTMSDSHRDDCVLCSNYNMLTKLQEFSMILLNFALPSVLSHCWLCITNNIQPIKLFIWIEVHMIYILWSGWFHCHPIISWLIKIQNGLLVLCQIDPVVLEKRLLDCKLLSVCLTSKQILICYRLCVWSVWKNSFYTFMICCHTVFIVNTISIMCLLMLWICMLTSASC